MGQLLTVAVVLFLLCGGDGGWHCCGGARVTTMPEYYREDSLSMTVKAWHETFTSEKAWVADGFFAGTVHALFESIFALLEKHDVPKDVPGEFIEGNAYVTEPTWRPRVYNNTGVFLIQCQTDHHCGQRWAVVSV